MGETKTEEVNNVKELSEKIQDVRINETINKDIVDTILKTSDEENADVFNILVYKDFSKIFEYIKNNKFVSTEMKSISKELKTQLESRTININNIGDLVTRLVRYYKLNTSTLALHYYNDKVRSDVENIIRILKTFVLANRTLIAEHTKHVILEKKPVSCEFTTVVSAEDLKVFDIFEKVSLNNLKEVLSQAEIVFTDIYISWVLILILAVSLQKTDYKEDEDNKRKKNSVTGLKEKIALLNTDSCNTRIKMLINVVKREKGSGTRTKKKQDTISKEDEKILEDISQEKPKNQRKPRKQNPTKAHVVSEHKNFKNDIKEDLSDSEKETINDNDIEIDNL